MGGLANGDVIRGSLNADKGVKIYQNLVDVISERSLRQKLKDIENDINKQ